MRESACHFETFRSREDISLWRLEVEEEEVER